MNKEYGSIRAIIFDLDGVLLSTDRYHFLAWKLVAERLGVPFSEEVNDRLRGVSRMDCIEILLENYTGEPLSLADKEALAADKNEEYRSYISELTPSVVEDYVRETLGALRARGYRLAVGSVSKNTKYILEKTDLIGFFDAISDGTNITHSKPDPEVFLKAAQMLGVEPCACAVVEDAVVGIEAAASGGMLPVAIGSAWESPLSRERIGSVADLTFLFCEFEHNC